MERVIGQVAIWARCGTLTPMFVKDLLGPGLAYLSATQNQAFRKGWYADV